MSHIFLEQNVGFLIQNDHLNLCVRLGNQQWLFFSQKTCDKWCCLRSINFKKISINIKLLIMSIQFSKLLFN